MKTVALHGHSTSIAAQLLHSLSLVRLVEKAEKDEPAEIIFDGPRPIRDDASKA